MFRTLSALKWRRPASFFFFPYTTSFWNGSSIFFSPLYSVVLPSLKITLSLTLKPFLNHSQPSLVSAFLKNHSQSSHSQVSITLSLLPLSLAPSHCRSSTSLPLLSLRHSLVATSLPRRRRSAAQIAAPSSPSQLSPGILFMVLPIPKIQSCSKHFSLFFLEFFFFGYELSEIFVCGYAICLSRLLFLFVYGSNQWVSLYGFILMTMVSVWFRRDLIWRWQTLLIELAYMLNSFYNHIWFNKIHLHPIQNCWASSLAIEVKPFMCFTASVFVYFTNGYWHCDFVNWCG